MTPIPAWAVLTLEYARGRIIPRYAQAASTPGYVGAALFPPPPGCPGQYKATQEEPQGNPAAGEGWWQQDTMGPVTWRQTRQLLHPWSSSHAARGEARTLGLSTGVPDMQQPESTLAHRHMHSHRHAVSAPFQHHLTGPRPPAPLAGTRTAILAGSSRDLSRGPSLLPSPLLQSEDAWSEQPLGS